MRKRLTSSSVFHYARHRAISHFLLLPCDAIAFLKISYLLATSLNTSLCLAISLRLSTESVAEARITLSVVSFLLVVAGRLETCSASPLSYPK